MLAAIMNGMVLAFGLIIPLGAQNVFVFNQGASQSKFKRAIPVVITASLCDTLLILLAVLGVSLIVLTLPVLKTIIFTIGLIFLIYMGSSIWKSDSGNLSEHEAAMPIKKQIMFALSVSLLNPHAIIDTIGVIGTNSLQYEGMEKTAFTLTCIIVSWIWFLGLSLIGRLIGHIDSDGKFLRIVNKISALMIWAVAAYISIQLIQSF
ncbi:LysE/ArgO family amino acid transporter [Bacillus sp. CLL-7-23]|uniref:LysE/ArgO family amino acid transporter n=1 Tax=Bacillus changyiensis TaxID=3004103 RepID=A0ABT4X3D9_9BACI|nr:LysE/ArgO family amino acid transporter [Bacillus changyiensis]MDA7026607.1 LysE/ArgO family amino acid transporter [Bacillus changyiensis]